MSSPIEHFNWPFDSIDSDNILHHLHPTLSTAALPTTAPQLMDLKETKVYLIGLFRLPKGHYYVPQIGADILGYNKRHMNRMWMLACLPNNPIPTARRSMSTSFFGSAINLRFPTFGPLRSGAVGAGRTEPESSRYPPLRFTEYTTDRKSRNTPRISSLTPSYLFYPFLPPSFPSCLFSLFFPLPDIFLTQQAQVNSEKKDTNIDTHTGTGRATAGRKGQEEREGGCVCPNRLKQSPYLNADGLRSILPPSY